MTKSPPITTAPTPISSSDQVRDIKANLSLSKLQKTEYLSQKETTERLLWRWCAQSTLYKDIETVLKRSTLFVSFALDYGYIKQELKNLIYKDLLIDSIDYDFIIEKVLENIIEDIKQKSFNKT